MQPFSRTRPPTAAARKSALIRKAGWVDTFMALTDVLLPTIANGIIMRRPGVMALAEWFDVDRRAVRRMQRIGDRYGQARCCCEFRGDL
jgi:hypothetical protein